jgi:hypothetical protein
MNLVWIFYFEILCNSTHLFVRYFSKTAQVWQELPYIKDM